MSFHEVPEDFDPLDVSVAEGVVVCPVAVALHHLLALVAAAPHLAAEPVAPVHVGGVHRADRVAVHVLHHLKILIAIKKFTVCLHKKYL